MSIDKWADWLASVGYGIDYNHDIDPPCTITDLAAAYQRQEAQRFDREPDPIEVYEWCIRENTGAFTHHPATRGGDPMTTDRAARETTEESKR